MILPEKPDIGLLNRILGEKIAIVSDKPQTTRNRIMGVHHLPNAQIVFLDTPGIHKAKFDLNRRMVKAALGTLEGVNLILVMVDAREAPGQGDQFIIEHLKELKIPVFGELLRKITEGDRPDSALVGLAAAIGAGTAWAIGGLGPDDVWLMREERTER